MDSFGGFRGNLESDVIEIGEGKKPKKWIAVCEPIPEAASEGKVFRIDGQQLEKSSKWTIRIVAREKTGGAEAVQQYL